MQLLLPRKRRSQRFKSTFYFSNPESAAERKRIGVGRNMSAYRRVGDGWSGVVHQSCSFARSRYRPRLSFSVRRSPVRRFTSSAVWNSETAKPGKARRLITSRQAVPACFSLGLSCFGHFRPQMETSKSPPRRYVPSTPTHRHVSASSTDHRQLTLTTASPKCPSAGLCD